MNGQENHVTRLADTVLAGGYCIGCGACAVMEKAAFEVGLDAYGCYQARRTDATPSYDPATVCPFSAQAVDENRLAEELFPDAPFADAFCGRHHAAYGGYVVEGEYRANGSSGGMGSWILCELLREGLVDRVIHVKPDVSGTSHGHPMFAYGISETVEEVVAGAKSRYYPVEMSRVLARVREEPGRYALVGLPCFIKAVRLLCRADPVLRERIVCCVGLVCGHLKSTCFADFLAWQCGIRPGALRDIDFRVKLPDRPAGEYGVQVVGRDGREEVRARRDFFAGEWGYGLFKYKACDYCDDVLAETADITVGDAWLGRYRDEPRGTNIVIVRHRGIHDLIVRALSARRLQLDMLGAEDVARSQAGGFRHRREGLAFRLHGARQEQRWTPPKRVAPDGHALSRTYRRIMGLRRTLRARSHTAFQEAVRGQDFDLCKQALRPLIRDYDRCYRMSPIKWLKRKLVSMARRRRM
ncbi:MAG: coenzyme F420 hydrogenase [Spartobacteria bacterium]|nr:coenzyme F420 hydrogenase [Spartobacteria bacterium]